MPKPIKGCVLMGNYANMGPIKLGHFQIISRLSHFSEMTFSTAISLSYWFYSYIIFSIGF